MNLLSTWGPSFLAVVVGTIMSAAFTWTFGIHAARKRRQGIRALVSQELTDNHVNLRAFYKQLSPFVEPGKDMAVIATVFASITRTLVWQQSRWRLPDVSEFLSPNELAQISEWYIRLETLARDYQHLIDMLRYTIPEGIANAVQLEPVVKLAGESAVRQLKSILEGADQLLSDLPTLPDPRFHWPSTDAGY